MHNIQFYYEGKYYDINETINDNNFIEFIDKCKNYTDELKYMFSLNINNSEIIEDEMYSLVDNYLKLLSSSKIRYIDKKFYEKYNFYSKQDLMCDFWLFIQKIGLPKIIKVNKLPNWKYDMSYQIQELDFTNIDDNEIYKLKKMSDDILDIIDNMEKNIIDYDEKLLYDLEKSYAKNYYDTFNGYYNYSLHPLSRKLGVFTDEDIELQILSLTSSKKKEKEKEKINSSSELLGCVGNNNEEYGCISSNENKKPSGSSGKGLMGLVAYGAQDIFLTNNPQITHWKITYR